jgi:hypothetical protein
MHFRATASMGASAGYRGDITRTASRWLAGVLIAGGALVGSACVDPSAVRSFSALAPDPSKVSVLTEAYADAPTKILDLDILHRLDAAALQSLEADKGIRQQQVTAINNLHAVLIDYMKALGSLADDKLVQTSTDAKDVTDGLTALQKADTKLGLTDNQINAVGSISTLLADLLTSVYREHKLADVIRRANAPFQTLIGTEQQIISRGVIPELNNVRERLIELEELDHGLQVDSEHQLVEAQKRHDERSRSKAPTPEWDNVDLVLQSSGAADLAAQIFLRREIDSDRSAVDVQIQAANDYSKALAAIAKAHTALFDQRGAVLSKAGAKSFATQASPLVKEAYTALQSLNKL